MTSLDGAIGALTGLQVVENRYLPEDAAIYNEREIYVQNADRFYIRLVGAAEMRTAREFLAKLVLDTKAELFGQCAWGVGRDWPPSRCALPMYHDGECEP